jgi:hypothetical protein
MDRAYLKPISNATICHLARNLDAKAKAPPGQLQRRQRLQQIRLQLQLLPRVFQRLPLDQKNVLHALAQRQDLGREYIDPAA